MRWRTGSRPRPILSLGSRRTLKRFAFWPTKVSGLQTVWLEIYKELQELVEVEQDLGDEPGGPPQTMKVRRWRTLAKSAR